jgi:hypothetical protein
MFDFPLIMEYCTDNNKGISQTRGNNFGNCGRYKDIEY